MGDTPIKEPIVKGRIGLGQPVRHPKHRGTSGKPRQVRYRFGRRIFDLRKARKLSQEDVAKHFGLTKTAWSNIERGLVPTSLDRLEEIAVYFEVPIESLILSKPDTEESQGGLFEQMRMMWGHLPPDKQQAVYDIAVLFKSQIPVVENETPPRK